MNKNYLWMAFALTLSAPSFAQNEKAEKNAVADQTFLNAITVCPVEQNPMTGLKELRGNSFANVRSEAANPGLILVDVISNPQLMNPRIMAPTRRMGSLTVQMTYPRPGFGLRCVMEVRPISFQSL